MSVALKQQHDMIFAAEGSKSYAMCPDCSEALHRQLYKESRWMGYRMQKNPLDLWIYATLLYDTRPDILIETGTWHGASALYYAGVMDQLNHGIVITIDPWNWQYRPQHPRIVYCNASSLDPELVKYVQAHAGEMLRVMVSLDSDHTKEHVLQELDIYGPLVKPSCYLVVEDTNIHGHPIRPDLPEGPWEAVHEWLPKHPEFEIKKHLEMPGTYCPDGWLRRIS